MRWRGMLAVFAAVALLGYTAVAAKTGAERRASGGDFEWHGHVAAGRTIEIKGVNGSIVAEPTTGSEVEVVANKSARHSDPNGVDIEVIEHEGGVTLCAVYPTPRGEPPNECKPGEGGRMNTRNNDVEVEYVVRVPATVRFTGRTVNGGIEARGLGADAEGHTVNGSVILSTRGSARATTVNGSIDCTMGKAPREAVEFTTVNGGIELTVPTTIDADFRASTVNGDISSDLPITVTGRLSRHRLKGTLGDGGESLVITTVNGDIRLRSGS